MLLQSQFVTMVRALACAVLAIGADAARRLSSKHATKLKHIAGVPIFNYEQAYGGNHVLNTVLAEGIVPEENWIVMVSDVSDKEIISLCATSKCQDVGHPSAGGVPFFKVRCSEAELESVVQQGHGIVKYIEPDLQTYLIPEAGVESDESQAATWGLNKIRVGSSPNRGKGVHIYVLDSGIRTSHEEFSGRAIPVLDYSSGEQYRLKRTYCRRRRPSCAVDNNGHGTHCAAIAAGVRYGVAPEAEVYALKVGRDTGGGFQSWTIGALDYVASRGKRPRVVSISMSSPTNDLAYVDSLNNAVKRGVAVVVGAGNDNIDAIHAVPANIDAVITVGATDSNDRRASFSNWGRCVNIWAPGVGVVSASHKDDFGNKTLSGTSLAAPHVAGAVAIIMSSLPRRQARARKRGVVDVVRSTLLSSARVDTLSNLMSDDTDLMLCVGSEGCGGR